jgi:hypothetical protein
MSFIRNAIALTLSDGNSGKLYMNVEKEGSIILQLRNAMILIKENFTPQRSIMIVKLSNGVENFIKNVGTDILGAITGNFIVSLT